MGVSIHAGPYHYTFSSPVNYNLNLTYHNLKISIISKNPPSPNSSFFIQIRDEGGLETRVVAKQNPGDKQNLFLQLMMFTIRSEEAKLDAGDENIGEWQTNIQQFNTGLFIF